MNLYERENSQFYWYKFTINGREFRGSTKRRTNDKRNAERVMHEAYQKQLNIVQLGEKPEITLSDAFDRIITSVDGETARLYDFCKRKTLGLDNFKDQKLWGLKATALLSDLSQHDLDDHREKRLTEGLRPNSVNVEIRILKRLVNMNAKRFNVNRDLDFTLHKSFKKSRYLSEMEEDLVLSTLKKKHGSASYDKAHDFCAFLMDTGVRLNEGLSIGWHDINMPSAIMEVYRPKTDVVSRVPIPDRTMDILKRMDNQPQPFMEMTRAVKILRKTLKDTCDTNDRVVTTRGSATIHSLRDTYATRLAQRGMSLQKIAKLLGHTSTTMTEKYVQFETEEVLEEARLILNR